MLLYEKGRMTAGNISFALPDGFYFNGLAEECSYENMICFYSNHNGADIRLDICIHQTEAPAKEYAEHWFDEDWEYIYFSPISPIQYGNLYGYHATYASSIKNRNTQHYACFLENLCHGEDHNVLEIVITCTGVDIQNVIQLPSIKTLIDSIREEKK